MMSQQKSGWDEEEENTKIYTARWLGNFKG